MRNRIKITLTILLLLFSEIIFGQISRTKLPSSGYNFLVISDFGRNGYGNQKEVAKVMGPVAAASNVKFIVTAGDNFQISGVQSVSDPLWMTSYENIYDYPVLLQDWYPALGNHDYAGNVQAEIDYSQVSRRWRMPANYYTLIKEGKDCSIRLVILDTQLIVRGIKDSDPQFSSQNAKRQLTWVDSVLSVSKEDWVVVVGHHPVYSAHPTRHNTEELVEHLNPLLKKFKVDFYISGHDHIFQHMKEAENEVDYIVDTAASEVRPATSNEMTVFAGSSPGFLICSATKKSFGIYFVGIKGEVIYSYERKNDSLGE